MLALEKIPDKMPVSVCCRHLLRRWRDLNISGAWGACLNGSANEPSFRRNILEPDRRRNALINGTKLILFLASATDELKIPAEILRWPRRAPRRRGQGFSSERRDSRRIESQRLGHRGFAQGNQIEKIVSKGIIHSFEAREGCGKSTQVRVLAERLRHARLLRGNTTRNTPGGWGYIGGGAPPLALPNGGAFFFHNNFLVRAPQASYHIPT